MLADRISTAIGKGFKIPPAPTIAARIAGTSQVAFSHFKNDAPQPGFSTPSPREEAFVFKIPLIPARFSRVCINGIGQSVLQSPGKAYLFDLTARTEVSLDTAYDAVRVHLPQATIDGLAYEQGLRRIGGLHAAALGQDDAILYRLAQAMLPAIINAQQVTTAFVEYLALAFHAHVIYQYGGVPRGGSAKGGPAPWQIRRSCELIDANLAGDPSIAMLSAECGLSSSHFARAFRASLSMTPHQWILKRRVERARTLLAQTDTGLAEIALMCGFSDQSHLGRVFLRETGISPAEWRRRQR